MDTLKALSEREVAEYYERLTRQHAEAVALMLRPESDNACALAAELGTGKTRVALTFAKEHGDQFILVIAPLQTEDGWAEEAEEQLPNLPFQRIQNTKDGNKALADFEWGLPGVYFIGREYFVSLGWERQPVMLSKSVQKTDTKGKLVFRSKKTDTWDVATDLVIFDESHKAQNHSSKTFKTIMNLNTGYKIAASGTFIGNSFDGAYSITKWLWPHRAEKNIFVWRGKWAEFEYDHFAPGNQRTVGEKVPGAFFKSLPCYVYIESIPFPIDDQVVTVALGSTQRRLYDEMEQNMISWLDDQSYVISELPITQRIRLKQAALGEYYLNENSEVDYRDDCESALIDELESILVRDFEDGPALIVTDSQRFARVVAARIGGEEWSGKVSRLERAQIKSRFLNGETKYLVGVIAAMGTGLNKLQFVTGDIAWLGESDNRIENEQTLARVARTGQRSVVRSRRIHGADTLQGGVYSTQLQRKLEMRKILKGGNQ